MKNVVIWSMKIGYNFRRYSTPWVCKMNLDGSHNFDERIGCYTGEKGEAGDLVVYEPIEGQVYGYGQKDYRGGNTEKHYAIWESGKFIPCDKIGRKI